MARAGYRTLTTALDGASERLRDMIERRGRREVPTDLTSGAGFFNDPDAQGVVSDLSATDATTIAITIETLIRTSLFRENSNLC